MPDQPRTVEEMQAALRDVVGDMKPLPDRFRRHMIECPCSKATSGGSYQHEPGHLDHSREPGGGGFFGHTREGQKRVPVIVPHRDACSAPLLGTLCLILGALLVWRWRRR